MTAIEILFKKLHSLTCDIDAIENIAEKMVKLSQVKRVVEAIEATALAGYELERGAWFANMNRGKEETEAKVTNKHDFI